MNKYVVPCVALNVTRDCVMTPGWISSLQATCTRFPCDPVQTDRVVSYGLPIVSASMAPVPLAVNFHQTVFVRGLFGAPSTLVGTQDGNGSVLSVVAAKLSTVFVYVLFVEVTGVAFAKLSLGGGLVWATVNNRAGFDIPPPGWGLTTVTGIFPPKAKSV